MVVGFFHDGPVYRDGNGDYHNGIVNDDIIDRYFYLADQFIGVTRINSIDKVDKTTIIHHPNVEFVAVPNLNTVKGQLYKKEECARIVEEQVKRCDYVIARVPSYVASMAIRYARQYNIPFLTEVVGCPWDSLWNYSWKGKLLAPRAYFSLKKLMKNVPYAVYVTTSFLQNRYPTNGISVSCSNVQISDPGLTVLEKRKARINENDGILTIGTAAAVSVRYKGQQYVIEALGQLKKQGITNYRYELVGGGSQDYLRSVAEVNDVAEQVVFKGGMAHSDVLKWLETIDIYAQPSRQEGLPRALIEAMSRGVPAFGAKTGGIPELLEPEFIIPNDKNCVNNICRLLKKMDRTVMFVQAERNYKEAGKYYIDVIRRERNRMLDLLREERAKKEN